MRAPIESQRKRDQLAAANERLARFCERFGDER